MIKTVWAQNPAGKVLQLSLTESEQDHDIVIFNITGLGPAKATINGQGGPNFDGVRVNSARLDARHMTITLAITATGDAEEVAKNKIYEYFPVKKQIVFGITTDDKDVYTGAIVENNEFNQFAKVENAVISLYCSNPYFIDVLLKEVIISSDFAVPNFQFPWSNESLTVKTLIFGLVTALPTGYVYYAGQVETGMDIVLEFTDAATEIVLTNVNGAQQMTIDVSDVGPTEAGDQIFINTRVGEKSIWFVRDAVWTNMINYVGLNDDWLQLKPGTNTIIVNATTGLDNIETYLTYRALREGV